MQDATFFSSTLPLIGLAISFAIVIILIRKKFHFGASLLIGSLILGIFSLGRIEIFDIGNAVTRAILIDIKTTEISFKSIELAFLMVLIFMLAKTMNKLGSIDQLITSLKSVFSHKMTIGIIPAIYGLMPVPGGALFSAPLVKKEGEQFHLTKNQANFLNVWFRHIWFPIYPISSAMILICSKDFTGLPYDIELYQVILANIVAFIMFIIIGMYFLSRFIGTTQEKHKRKTRDLSGLKYLLVPITPVILYIAVYIINSIIPFFSVQPVQNTVFIIGLLLSFIILFFFSNKSINKYLSIIKEVRSFHIAYAIFGILIFREMFDITQVNSLLADVIKLLPVPPLFIIIILPCILGLITGYNLGAIALSYVIIQPFFHLIDISIIGLTSIIFMSSFIGYLISPIHLCNVVSSDHFKTDTTRMYRMYLPSVLVLIITHTVFIYLFYHI